MMKYQAADYFTGHFLIQVNNKRGQPGGGKYKTRLVSRSLRSLGRSVGRRSRGSIVNIVVKDPSMCKAVAAKIGTLAFYIAIYKAESRFVHVPQKHDQTG